MTRRRHAILPLVAAVLATAAPARPAAAGGEPPLPLLPWPKQLEPGNGNASLPASARIVAASPALAPLAAVLASDIRRVHRVQLAVSQAPPAAGDIVLRLVPDDPALAGPDAHRITVDATVTVEGRTYQAVACGMMTVVQALRADAGSLAIAPEGLGFPGLQTSGRALRVEATDADESGGRRPPHVTALRRLAVPYGHDGTRLWSSFLIRARRVEIGEIAANIGRTNIGKGWGAGISVYTATGGGEMLPERTYLLVARHTFHAGNDLIHLWVDPVPGRQPADNDAAVVTRAFDNPQSDTLTIRMQPYGRGSYILEFHLAKCPPGEQLAT